MSAGVTPCRKVGGAVTDRLQVLTVFALSREVLPHAPDAWIDTEKTKIGYEIPFNRHFYVFEPPRPLAVIDAVPVAATVTVPVASTVASAMAAVAVFAVNADRQWPSDEREPVVTAEALRLMEAAALEVAAGAKPENKAATVSIDRFKTARAAAGSAVVEVPVHPVVELLPLRLEDLHLGEDERGLRGRAVEVADFVLREMIKIEHRKGIVDRDAQRVVSLASVRLIGPDAAGVVHALCPPFVQRHRFEHVVIDQHDKDGAALNRVVHVDQIYPTENEIDKPSSPKKYRAFVVVMSAASTLMILLGLVLAFKTLRTQWPIWLSLVLGIATPAFLLWLGQVR